MLVVFLIFVFIVAVFCLSSWFICLGECWFVFFVCIIVLVKFVKFIWFFGFNLEFVWNKVWLLIRGSFWFFMRYIIMLLLSWKWVYLGRFNFSNGGNFSLV